MNRSLFRHCFSAGLVGLILLACSPACLGAEGEGSPAGVFGNRILEILNSGGEVMWVILGVSILGLALILEAAFRTRRARILPPKPARILADAQGNGNVQELLNSEGNANVHRIVQVAHRWRKGTSEQVQAAIEETVDEALWRLKRSLRPIGVLANTAPLLGLLGTVIGIIRAFEVVAEKGALGDPAKLAGG
ncbi:MAG: MotA/TolQ/ExbB proton channel family protein, partial [Verrucomicrobiota bacterium]